MNQSYKNKCINKAQKLLEKGEKSIISSSSDLIENRGFAREEICTGSNIYRGYYNPSPVYDLIVGKAKRGKLLKSLNVRTNTFFRYFWDQDNRLRKIIDVYKGRIAATEYLEYNRNAIIGINTDEHGLRSVCEQLYHREKIRSVAILQCFPSGGKNTIINYREERYFYFGDTIEKCIVDILDYANGEYYYYRFNYKIEYEKESITGGHIISKIIE